MIWEGSRRLLYSAAERSAQPVRLPYFLQFGHLKQYSSKHQTVAESSGTQHKK